MIGGRSLDIEVFRGVVIGHLPFRWRPWKLWFERWLNSSATLS